MKVIVNGQLIDADKEPITLVFENTKELHYYGSLLKSMVENPGTRLLAIYPDEMDGNKIIEEVKQICKDNGLEVRDEEMEERDNPLKQ